MGGPLLTEPKWKGEQEGFLQHPFPSHQRPQERLYEQDANQADQPNETKLGEGRQGQTWEAHQAVKGQNEVTDVD